MYTILYRLLSKLFGIEQTVNSFQKKCDDLKLGLAKIEQQLNGLNDLCAAILDRLNNPPRAVKLLFTAVVGDVTYTEVENMIITDVQVASLSILPVDIKGNPASVDGVPVWSSSAPEIVAIEADIDNPLKATATAVGPLGTAQISVVADADLGEGVVEIVGVLDFEVKASQAVSLTINAVVN